MYFDRNIGRLCNITECLITNALTIVSTIVAHCVPLKDALYRIWCGVSRLGDSGVHTLGDNSAFVNPAGQL